MKTRVSKWGNSLAVRIPKSYAQEVDLHEGCEVEIVRHRGDLVLKRRRYSLDELLRSVTPENIHGETDTGAPMGREEW